MKNLFIFRTFCSAKIKHACFAFFHSVIPNPKYVTQDILTHSRHSELVSESYQCGIKSWICSPVNQILKQVQHDSCLLNDVNKSCRVQFIAPMKSFAFSLVELLMALLVASLLMAALAPVMTKKYKESVEVYGSSSGVRMDYTKTFTKDTKWIVPNGVNYITVTSIGGGGGGGGASYGYKEITSSESNWVVPQGVTKLRVFMTGAGGGGASGGQKLSWSYTDIPALNNAEGETLKAGTYTFATGITTPDDYKTPELNELCKISGSTNWLVTSDNTTIAPNTKFAKFFNNVNVTLNKITICGAGGGNGGAFGSSLDSIAGIGGSGSIVEQTINPITAPPGNISYGIGAPGGNGESRYFYNNQAATQKGGAGGAGYRDFNGTAGTDGYLSSVGGDGCAGGGGGGGGGASGINAGSLYWIVGGGGGGGGGAHGWSSIGRGGAGGNGGGNNAGTGGSGGVCQNASCINGTGGTKEVQGAKGVADSSDRAGGGGGGGGKGGIGGGNGLLSSIFGTNNCNGRKPGAIHLWYSIPSVSNGLKCQYKDKSNSGAGGGAGQIWIGEIDVTPGQKINFNIGLGGDGGNKDTGVGINGKDGGSTSITVNGNTYSVSGGKGGRYESDDTYIANSGGLGGGIKTNNFNNIAKYNNWTNIEYTNGGSAGAQGNTVANGAGGGKGGNTYKKDGTVLQGGNPGGAQADGSNAISDNYGAGGGGGGGVINYGSNPGHGGKGANGYIYIEWGSANGGGGASGQVITEKNVLVSAGSTIEIKVGKGGSANDVLTVLNGVNGYFGQKGNDGGESYIIVPPNIEEKHGFAKGGIGGYPAGSNHGTGGNFDDSVVNSTKGQPGNDEFGGNGGNITQALCPLLEAMKGLGGCGGNLTISDSDPVNACANPSSGPVGKNAATIGGGGGGGAVKDNAAYKGGNGANGAVIIEWNN